MSDKEVIIKQSLEEHKLVTQAIEKELLAKILELINYISETLIQGNKILLCGNGGSAADCQHFATELVCRFVKPRGSLPAIALTTDTSILTAVSNDYGYERVFARQVEGLGHQGDLLIAFSTSGNSSNILAAVEKAKQKGLFTIGFSGKDGGKLGQLADWTLKIPSTTTARIQEGHLLVIHIIMQVIDELFAADNKK